MGGETPVLFWGYYGAAIRRVFWAVIDWMLGQGVLLTLLLAVALVVVASSFAAIKATRRRHSWGDARAEIARAARDFVVAGLAATSVGFVILFTIYFVQDAPKQLAEATQHIKDLKEALKAKTVEFVTLDYKNEWHWIMPPEDRPRYNTWAVRIGVTSKSLLHQPRAYLVYANKLDEPRWSAPIEVKTQLAWYAYEHSYDLDAIELHDYVVPFYASRDGKHLFLLTNGKAPELEPMTKGIRPGKYEMKLLIRADNLEQKSWKNVIATVMWSGSMTDFQMELVEDRGK